MELKRHILAVMGLVAVMAMAQTHDVSASRPSFEQFLRDKTAFIVHEMQLPAADSMAFVPVYTELQQRKAQLFQKYSKASRDLRRQLKQGGTPDESLYVEVVNNETALGVEDAKLEQEYVVKFRQVLSPRQLYDYIRAEKKFKTKFMTSHPKHEGKGKQ